MKTNYFIQKQILGLLSLLIISVNCLAQTALPTATVPLTTQPAATVANITSNPAHYTSEDAAANYILNYAKAFPTYVTEAAHGAWIEIDANVILAFKFSKDTHTGLIVWFYQNGGFNVAYAKSENAEEAALTSPLSLIDQAASYNHGFCGGAFTVAEVTDKRSIITKLESFKNRCAFPAPAPTVAGKDLVDNGKNYTRTFKSQINQVNTPGETVPQSCYQPAGFIHDEQIIKLIKGNSYPVRAVRIYWGYDNSIEEANNRLRMILIGVDDEGANILDENAIILERSWPPDVN
jgi:hypothetical protein